MSSNTAENPKHSPADTILKIALILGAIYLFIVGINGMSAAFKLFGKETSQQILEATSSPFVGLFIGIIATALVQSSSTTTSLIVGMVAAGAISIEGAIPMVMGANIGTSVTNTFVSFGHVTRPEEFKKAFAAATVHDFFNLISVLILFPIEYFTGFLAKLATVMSQTFEGIGGMKLANPVKIITGPAVDLLSWMVAEQALLLLLISAALIFGMLIVIVKTLRSLVLDKVKEFFDAHLFKNAARAMIFGVVLTVLVQSSSITTSLIIPLAGAGVLSLGQIFPYTLGSNVGTTMTAMLAAMATGEPEAVTVSFAHFLFNVVGILIIWPVAKFRQVPMICADWLANAALKNRWIPVIFVAVVFFGIPFLVILISRSF